MYKTVKYGLINLAFFSAAATPAFAYSFDINGNGSDSFNRLYFQSQSSNVVSQSNTTSINNNITAVADTGGNTIDGTTGGSSVIDTGDGAVDVNVTNTAGSNLGAIEGCGCEPDDVQATIADNGTGTDNKLKLGLDSLNVLSQQNTTDFDTDVEAVATTGDNKIKDTTGGDSSILSGAATVLVDVANQAGSNTGSIGGEGSGGGLIEAQIADNGADSTNHLGLGVENQVVLSQLNQTGIDNDVEGIADSGDNKIKDTTGDSSLIETGDTLVDIGVDNAANFNTASVDCDCVESEVSAAIKNNGTDSYSKIKANLQQNQVVTQTNRCGTKPYFSLFSFFGKRHHKGSSADCFDNQIGGYALSGTNTIKGNTNAEDGDPAVLTGTSHAFIDVVNTAGFNTYPMFVW